MCPFVAVKAKAAAVATSPGGSSLILETNTLFVEENIARVGVVVELTASSLAGWEGRRHGFKKQEQGGCQADSPHRRGLAERHEEEETLATLILVFSEGDDMAYFHIVFLFCISITSVL